MGKSILSLALVVVIAALATPTLAQDPDLVGWWPLDGSAADASGNGHDGVLEGDATYVPGVFGQAISLDGDGDYVMITDYKGLMSSSPVTVTAWVRTTGETHFAALSRRWTSCTRWACRL